MLSDITPLILTFNEAPNLRRLLNRLDWATEIVVLDSFSMDDTVAIARGFKNATCLQRKFDTHSAQWNYGLGQVTNDWILSLDADYLITDELRDEIACLNPPPEVSAYFARFRYCIHGRPLRATLYPPRAVLFRRSRCRYVQDGHTQVLSVEGQSRHLNGLLLHDDRKPLTRWLQSQRSYVSLEADKLLDPDGDASSLADRMRRWIWPAAPAAFVYTLLMKRCLFDGWRGWFYALQRTYAEVLLSLELLDRRISSMDAENKCSSGEYVPASPIDSLNG